MKKPEKNVFAEKALKIKENIKLPQVKFPIGNHLKKKDETEKKDEGGKTASQSDTDRQAVSQRGYHREVSQGKLRQTGTAAGGGYQAGTLYGSSYQRGASVGGRYHQTGMMPGNVYTQETARSSLYQTGAISGNTYARETARSTLYQTGALPGNAYQTGNVRSNMYQTGALPRNAYQTGTHAGNAYGTGTIRRSQGQSGRGVDITASEDFLQRNRRQSGGAGENLRRTGASRRNQRQPDRVQEDVRGANAKAGQGNRRQAKAYQGGTQQGVSGRNSREAVSSRRNAPQAGETVKGISKISGSAAYIKIALVAVLLLFVIFDLSDEPDSAVKLETVEQNVVKAAGLDSSEPAEPRMIKRFYGLNPKDYDGAVLYAPADNMDAHELFLVKLKDDTQKKAVEDAIKERLDTQLKSFEGYGAEQTALLEGHVLSEKGNYMLYIVGEYAEDAQKAFAESL